uniref:Uncharacterized protein n=1 Tax=Ditylenchus dipsaci TaxID=166011 RepID=A0A915E7E2_9BILA
MIPMVLTITMKCIPTPIHTTTPGCATGERWLVTEVHEEAQFHFTSRYHGLPKTASRLRFEDHPVHQVRDQDEGEEQL